MVNERPGFDETDKAEDESQDSTVDLSGRPLPEGVTAVIDGKIAVPCDVRYDGRYEGYRRYVVDAHTDWARHRITELNVEKLPVDVRLILDMHGATDDETQDATAGMTVTVGVSV